MMKMEMENYNKLKKRDEAKNCWLLRMMIVMLLMKLMIEN